MQINAGQKVGGLALKPNVARTVQNSSFRELPSIEHWSGYLTVSNMTSDQFEKILKEVARDVNIRISGWRIDNESSDGFTFYMCRQQRKKYGPVPPSEKYKYNQERFTIEDFGDPKMPITYSVETRHCKEPEN